VRFSAEIHPKGSPEALRDPRGSARKFYTDQGNCDLGGNDLPVSFIRDAIKLPDMVHSLKPSPVTNIHDPNRPFDFFSHIPDVFHVRSPPASQADVGLWDAAKALIRQVPRLLSNSERTDCGAGEADATDPKKTLARRPSIRAR